MNENENAILNVIKTNPTLKGFDRRGLYRVMQFYETYKDNEKLRTLSAQLSWSNILTMRDKEKHIQLY